MFDHVQIKVPDLAASRSFYEVVLGALGYTIVLEFPGFVVGFGTNPHDMFEVAQTSKDAPLSHAVHIAFKAKSREAIDKFHAVAIAHGAKDNGAPGLRPDYEPGYYAAFVIDPNGHNLEAVFKETF